MPPDLKAVLFLGGPAELMTFVCDVSEPDKPVVIIDGFGIKHLYCLQPSSLGVEGWSAVADEPGTVRMMQKVASIEGGSNYKPY